MKVHTEFQVVFIVLFSVVSCCHSAIEGWETSQAHSVLDESILAFWIIFLSSMCFDKQDLCHDLPRYKCEAHWSVVPQVFLSTLLKNGSYVCLLAITSDFAR